MKIVTMSDTHLRHLPQFKKKNFPETPPGDILIHAGDFGARGDLPEMVVALRWFGSLPHKHKVMIAGNHDGLFELDPVVARSLVPKNVVYLEDSMVEIEGLKIYGSPWQPEFFNWAFNLPRGPELRAKWKKIPEGIDILITHGPPFGIMDWSDFGNEHAGCADLADEIKRVKPRLHVFGHIHGGYGRKDVDGVIHINAAICDEAYNPTHKPIVIELEPRGGNRT